MVMKSDMPVIVVRKVATRLATGALMLLIVSLIIFLCTQALPGDVARVILGQNATPDQVEALRSTLGLDRPLWEQYFSWLAGMVSGDFGTSLSSGIPVSDMLSARLANSLTVVSIAFCIVVVLAFILGILAARKPNGALDVIISGGSHLILSLPEFVVGIILIVVLSTNVLHLFPPSSVIDSRYPAIAQGELLVLPIVTLVLIGLPHLTESIKTQMREELSSPAVTWARLSGVRERDIILRYALPGTLPPVLQVVAITVGYLLGGSVAVETVFSFPGIGSALVAAVSARDIVTVQDVALFIALIMVCALVIADIVGDLSNAKIKTRMK